MKYFRFFLFASLFVLFCEVTLAQVSIHGTGQVKESNSNTNQLILDNFNVPVGNDILVVVGTRNADYSATNMSFNGTPMTRLNGVTFGVGNSSIWYLPLGNVSSPITANIEMILNDKSQTKMMSAICFKNVLQSDPITGFASNTYNNTASSSTLGNSGNVGDMVFDIISSIGTTSTAPTLTKAAGQTLIGTGISTSQPKRRISSSYKSLTNATTNMTWSISGSSGGAGIHLSARIKSASVLPVELVSFTAENKTGTVVLKWSTASELNNDEFIIQRSLDGKNWRDMGKVAGAGTTHEMQSYLFLDEEPSIGLNYYRLVQKDFDGKKSYSPAVTIRVKDNGTAVSIFPNPWSGGLCSLTVLNALEHEGTLEIFDHEGKLVHQEKVVLPDLEKSVILVNHSSFVKGHYFVRLTTRSRKYNCRLLVQAL